MFKPAFDQAGKVWAGTEAKAAAGASSHGHVTFVAKQCAGPNWEPGKDAAACDQFNIDGYPTVKLIHKDSHGQVDKVVDYHGDRSVDSMIQFLNSNTSAGHHDSVATVSNPIKMQHDDRTHATSAAQVSADDQQQDIQADGDDGANADFNDDGDDVYTAGNEDDGGYGYDGYDDGNATADAIESSMPAGLIMTTVSLARQKRQTKGGSANGGSCLSGGADTGIADMLLSSLTSLLGL